METKDLSKIEKELIDIILDNGENKELNLEDLSLAWTWNLGDNDEYTESIKSVHLETDCNDASVVFVDFENDSMSLNELNNYDSECLEYVYDEITTYY